MRFYIAAKLPALPVAAGFLVSGALIGASVLNLCGTVVHAQDSSASSTNSATSSPIAPSADSTSSPIAPSTDSTSSPVAPSTDSASSPIAPSRASASSPIGSSTDSTTTPAPSANSVVLQGGVQKVELNLEKLRDVGLDLKQVLKAASSLYDEVTIQPVRIVTEPEVVGRGIIINIPVQTVPVGPPQPARKDRVDRAMSGIRPVIDTMKQNVDNFVAGKSQLALPDSVMTELQPEFDKWVQTVNSVAARETQLEQATQAPPYDNQTIGQLAIGIEKDVKSLDETRRKIYKVIRREGKKIAAANGTN